MSLESSLFANHARGNIITFLCSNDFRIGAYQLREGDPVKVVDDKDGMFSVYVEWAEGRIGRLNARDINKLAGREVVQDISFSALEWCCCLELEGDNPDCKIHPAHWVGGE